MNTIDVYIKGVIKGPYKHIDKDYCCWEIIAEVYSDGDFTQRTIRRCSKTEIDKIRPGYSWVE